MTNFTQRVLDGSNTALKYLENGDSVRKACKKAGISVTSLYHTTTPEQREKAFLSSGSSTTGARKGPGRRRKVRQAKSQSFDSNDVVELQKQLSQAHEYIAKLEHKLIKSIVFSDAGQ